MSEDKTSKKTEYERKRVRIGLKNRKPGTTKQSHSEKPHSFQPGNTLGKKGKPRGTKTKSQTYIEKIGEDNLDKIVAGLTQEALNGDFNARKLLLDKAWPAVKGRIIRLNVPNLDSLQNIGYAVDEVIAKMVGGDFSAPEAAEIISVFEYKRKVIENEELKEMMEDLKIRVESMEGSKNVY